MPVTNATDRAETYARLHAQVGRTPLYELQYLDVPNECRIFCKEEYRNPTNSHYDRETLALLAGREARGDIRPDGRPLLETTTGSSGASLAWMCRVLGYKCRVIIPADMPSARIEQIRSYGAEIEEAPRGEYIRGLVGRVREYVLKSELAQYQFTNHSWDTEFGPGAMSELATEVVAELADLGQDRPDYFVSALGNGISAHGISRVLCPLGTKLVGVEPHESPTVLRRKFPDEFAQQYSPEYTDHRHELYGTGPGQDADIEFPNISAVLPSLGQILLPDQRAWLSAQRALADIEGKHVGNSSAACVWAAMRVAETAPAGSTILTLFYDAAWRYLPITPASY